MGCLLVIVWKYLLLSSRHKGVDSDQIGGIARICLNPTKPNKFNHLKPRLIATRKISSHFIFLDATASIRISAESLVSHLSVNFIHSPWWRRWTPSRGQPSTSHRDLLILRATTDPISTSSPLKLFDIARKRGKFLYACAPMVRYSKLAFRQTVHYYGTDLCWTPMILAKEFNRNKFARDSDLTVSTTGSQPPTILQFGANVPLELARASSLAAPWVNGVDLNCGCPQSWACAETLGAALMNERALVKDMVVETRQKLREDGWAVGMHDDVNSPKGRSVSVKIRIHKDLRYVGRSAFLYSYMSFMRLTHLQRNNGLSRHSDRSPAKPKCRLGNHPPPNTEHALHNAYSHRSP